MSRKHKELALLLAVIAVYAALAFHNLGDRHAPQSTWATNEAAAFDFGAVQDISRFQFMLGARDNIPFNLFASEDNENWHFELTIEEPTTFAWHERTLNTRARYIQIIPFWEGLRIQEAAFRNERGEILIPVNFQTPNAFPLFDEQHLVPERGGIMNSFYFDEIYHARTGYEFLHGLTVFENTHPPMGKNFIAMSISAFGMTPFGWRFPGTLAGVLMIPLIYLFARLIFGKDRGYWAVFAAFLFAFDFMTFAQTRIATIDSYVTLFIIAMYLCMYAYVKYCKELPLKKSLALLALTGIFAGLAIASKWQGVYAVIGLPVVFFPAWYGLYKQKRREAWITLAACFGFFIALPLLIYTLAYIPFTRAMGDGRGLWATMLANQFDMFNYHSQLTCGHPFASRWWEWPLITRPIFYYQNVLSDTLRQSISSFGNPAIWWAGIPATFFAAKALFNKALAPYHGAILFLLVGYAAQFVPWMFVYRATFIYHYFPSVPFVVLLLTFCFKMLVSKYFPRLVWGYAGLVAGLFALFYPVLSAAPVPFAFVQQFLRWFPAWVLA